MQTVLRVEHRTTAEGPYMRGVVDGSVNDGHRPGPYREHEPFHADKRIQTAHWDCLYFGFANWVQLFQWFNPDQDPNDFQSLYIHDFVVAEYETRTVVKGHHQVTFERGERLKIHTFEDIAKLWQEHFLSGRIYQGETDT